MSERAVSAGQLSPDGSWRWDGTHWVPVIPALALPGWLGIRLREQARPITLAWMLAVGLLVDQALRTGAAGLAASAAVGLAAVAALTAGGVRRPGAGCWTPCSPPLRWPS